MEACRNFLFIALFFICGCSVVKKPANQSNTTHYFVSIPIGETTRYQIPCVIIQIEDKTFHVMLDLGFRGHLTMASDDIRNLASKTPLSEKTMYGVRGKKYNKKRYQIPKLKIGTMTFSLPILQEDNAEFLRDATFVQGEPKTSSKEPGRLGWELFALTPLLIDIQNGRIAFCDSLKTLEREGYATENFIKAPLLLERGLVEFEAYTPNGALRCILDTGTTWNVLNSEIIKDIDKNTRTAENRIDYSFFLIENTDFGSISFHQMPIQMPIAVEAILGKDFLQNLKTRGLKIPPSLAIGDGALGFWSALEEEYPQCRQQRCWVHKTANILDKMPKSVQPNAKRMIHEMYTETT